MEAKGLRPTLRSKAVFKPYRPVGTVRRLRSKTVSGGWGLTAGIGAGGVEHIRLFAKEVEALRGGQGNEAGLFFGANAGGLGPEE